MGGSKYSGNSNQRFDIIGVGLEMSLLFIFMNYVDQTVRFAVSRQTERNMNDKEKKINISCIHHKMVYAKDQLKL